MRRLAIASGLLLALVACGGGSDNASSSGAQAGAERQQLGGDGGAGAGPDAQAGGKGAAKNGVAAVQIGRATIRTASMTVRVDDVAVAARAAVRTAEATGGFLEAEKTDTETATLTLRVPPEDFTATSDARAKLGTVVDRSVATDDVTGDVADVDGRLKAARASVERVRALLNRATTISEITALESELNEREAALESLQTRQRALAGKTSFASLSVTFTPPVLAAGAEPKAERATFTDGLAGGWRVFKTTVSVLLLVLGAVLPFALFALAVGVPVYVLKRRATARA